MEAEVIRICCTLMHGDENTCGTVSCECPTGNELSIPLLFVTSLSPLYELYRVCSSCSDQ